MELSDKEKVFLKKKLQALSSSRFRGGFNLHDKELKYVKEKGLEKIEEDAYYFIKKRLGERNILNDGKQTPFSGHPVFIAQHATATCCRGCLEKWHHIGKGRKLEKWEIRYIVALIMSWIKNDVGIIIMRSEIYEKIYK